MKKEWYFDRFCGRRLAVYAEDGKILEVGVEDEKVDEVIGIISEHSCQRKEIVPSTASYGVGVTTAFPLEVTVGGATIFVTNIERFEKV